MPNLVTFEQIFHIFLGRLGMQVDYAKTDLVVTARNTRTRVHVLHNNIYFFHDISCFISTVNSVIDQYNCHEDMPSFGEGGCDRLKALKGALFSFDLTNSSTNSGLWLFKP